MRRFARRLAALFGRGRAEREMEREMAAHLALIEEDYVRRGLGEKDARLAARRAYGGVEQARELHRDARSFVWIEQAVQDVRHAWRSLAKSPGFMTVAVLSLAFGIGVNASIFTLVNAILLKKLPVPDPDRIVQVTSKLKDFEGIGFNYAAFRELQRQSQIFSGLIGFSARFSDLEIGGASRKVHFELVTGGFFGFFGARPALGRLLDEEDDRVEQAHPVCVLSYDAWQSLFGGDPGVLDRTVEISAVKLQVVGVAPAGFVGPELQRRFDLWVPTSMVAAFANKRDNANYIWLHLLGRLRPGISLAEAGARLAGVSRAIEGALPPQHANAGAVYWLRDASSGWDSWRTALHDPLVILMGAVSLVLLVACANLANLLLARAQERRQEFAIKLALGISRWRLLRQLLIETFGLAFAGGAAALVLAGALTRFLLAVFNSGNPAQRLDVTADTGVLLFTFAVCVFTALIAGLYPAWQATRGGGAPGLKGGSLEGGRRNGIRRGLILVQVTLAVVLLFGASLFTHSLRKLKVVDLGYDIERVVSIDIGQKGPRAQRKLSIAPPALLDVLDRVRRIPGVEAAAYCSPCALSGAMMSDDVQYTDAAGVRRKFDEVEFVVAGAGYFSTMRMPLRRGREFTPADRAGSQLVIVVNQALASQLWRGSDPIGRQVDAWGLKGLEVIGVVGDARNQGVREHTRPIGYLAFEQNRTAGATLEVRFRGGPVGLEREVRQIVQTSAPAYMVSNISSMELLRDRLLAQDRLLAWLSSLFGALGTALALVGIYGLIAYSVTRRTREIGIRISIGAQRTDVLWLFLKESVALVSAGIALGLPLALVLARLLRKALFEVSTSDPVGIAATLGLIAVGGLAASLAPSRRATRVDPVRALRYD